MDEPKTSDTSRSQIDKLEATWRSSDLGSKFLIVTAAMLAAGMLIIGAWISSNIKSSTLQAAANSTSLFTDRLIEPHIQELAANTSLSQTSIDALDRLLEATGKPNTIVGIKIWRGDTIVYSNHHSQVMTSLPGNKDVAAASTGKVVAELGQLTLDDSRLDNEPPLAVLEIYSPLRQSGTHQVIAVAETYKIADHIVDDIWRAKTSGWIVLVHLTAAILILQFLVVRQGGRIIAAQRGALTARIADLLQISQENNSLHMRTKDAQTRLAELNERILRRVGADLHDGPVQLLGAASIHASTISDIVSGKDPELGKTLAPEMELLRDALADALDEIRHLSSGLAPPDIERLQPSELIELAIRRHERRTSTTVTREIGSLPETLTISNKMGIYRLLQEGLNNAVRHAEGKGQFVSANATGTVLTVIVADTGPGIDATKAKPDRRSSQGLQGMMDRIVALDGSLDISSSPGSGTRITAQFRI